MPDETNRNEEKPEAAAQKAAPPEAPSGPRMLPAAIIVLAHVAAIVYSLQVASLMQVMIGFALAPILASIFLTIWWLRSSGIPLRERYIGLALFPVILILVLLTQESNGSRLLMFLLPTLTIGAVAILLVTARLQWPMRRWSVVGFMIACTLYFGAQRVDDIGGDILPVLAWRWSPTIEELFAESRNALAISNEPAVLPAEVVAEDWPEFRGPARDSRLSATFATDWDESPPREIWRHRVGLGWGSFTAVGDYLFTQEQRGTEEVVVCYRADTGEEVWTNHVSERFKEGMGDGPRATPTYSDGQLYALGATGILQRLDPSTGEAIWMRDIKADTGARVPVWGFASSPLVTGELVIVFSGGKDDESVVAYKRDSGDVVWKSGDGTHGYASGHLANLDGVPQILFCSDVGIQSFAPETGDVLWQYSWVARTNPRCVQPLVSEGNTVMIGTAGGQGTRKIRVEKNGTTWNVEEEWTTRGFKPYFNDFVQHEGYLYGYDGSRFMCIDASTGERVWKGSRYGGQVLLLSEMDTLLILSEKGDIILLEASPDGENELARIKALSSKTWNHPVIAHGKLYVRNSEEAVCYELPAV